MMVFCLLEILIIFEVSLLLSFGSVMLHVSLNICRTILLPFNVYNLMLFYFSFSVYILVEWKSKSEECAKEIQEWKKQASAATTSISKLNRQINSKVQTSFFFLQSILEDLKMSNVELNCPIHSLSLILQETQINQLDERKQEITEKCDLECIELPLILDPMETESSTGKEFDFSQLNRSLLQDRRPSDREKLQAEFKQKIDALVSEIERTAPNLKALDQYKTLQEKERDVTEEFEAARKEEKQVADAYNSVKQRRY